MFFMMIFGITLECENTVNLAKGLNLDLFRPLIYGNLSVNCCKATFTNVVCSGGLVTMIYWNNYGLNGSINSTAIPVGLEHLSLAGNPITESDFEFPVNLTFVNLGYTRMNMSIPELPPKLLEFYAYETLFTSLPVLPDGIQRFEIFNSKVRGQLSSLPSTLKFFQVDNNFFNGSLPLMPSSLETIKVSRNSFTNTLGTLPMSLISGSFDYNMFNGSLGVIPNNTVTLNVRHNRLTGSFSIESSKLVSLYVDGNQMSGLLPLFPDSLLYLYLGSRSEQGNQFQGNLIVYAPLEISAYKNNLTGISISNSANLTLCNLLENPNLSSIGLEALKVCQVSIVYLSTTSMTYTVSLKTSMTYSDAKSTFNVLAHSRSTTDVLRLTRKPVPASSTQSVTVKSTTHPYYTSVVVSTKPKSYSSSSTVQFVNANVVPFEPWITIFSVVKLVVNTIVLVRLFVYLWRRQNLKRK